MLPRIKLEVPRIRPEVQPCSSREDLSGYTSESEADIQIINYVDIVQNLVCTHCSKNFETEKSLVEHKNAVSASLLATNFFLPSPEVKPSSGRSEDLSSSETEAEIQIVNYVNNAAQNIQHSHVCDHCSKNFDTEQNLLEHKNAVSASLIAAFF